jgi:glycosyltransferase involved in cell wall biosynthesis
MIICVIPAYNEAPHIGRVIAKVKPFVDRIIVVDDHSADATSLEAEKAGALVVRHLINRGQGAALRTGTKLALDEGADIIVHFDADDQFQAEDIPAMVAPLLAGEADAVLGSRFLGHANLPKLKRHLIMPLARLANRLFFNIRLSDPQSGFRALARPCAARLRIENDGMAHCSEILHRLFRQGERVVEVPITVIYHEYGQKLSGGFKILKDLIIQKFLD